MTALEDRCISPRVIVWAYVLHYYIQSIASSEVYLRLKM